MGLFLTISTVNNDMKCKRKFGRESLQTVFCFYLAAGLLKFNLFENFRNCMVFNTLLT